MTLLTGLYYAVAVSVIGTTMIGLAAYRGATRIATIGVVALILGYLGACGLIWAKAITGP